MPPQPPPLPPHLRPSSPRFDAHPIGYSSLQRNHSNQNHVDIPTNSHMGSLPERGRLRSRNTNQLNSSQLSPIPQNGYLNRSPSPVRNSSRDRRMASSPHMAPSSHTKAPPVHNRSSSHDEQSTRLISNGPSQLSSGSPPAIVPRKHKKHPNRLRNGHRHGNPNHVANQNISQLDRNLANHLTVKDPHVIPNRALLYTVASTPL